MKSSLCSLRCIGPGRAVVLAAFAAGVTAFGDMMKDSPVKFPDKGALPSKYLPDVSTSREVPEKNYSISVTPQRSLEQIARIQAEMTKGEFTPPSSLLPPTRERSKGLLESYV